MNQGTYYVIELLQKFTNKELKDLQALANCSYFNTEKKVVVLLSSLIEIIKTNKSTAPVNLVAIYNVLNNTKLKALSKKQLNSFK